MSLCFGVFCVDRRRCRLFGWKSLGRYAVILLWKNCNVIFSLFSFYIGQILATDIYSNKF